MIYVLEHSFRNLGGNWFVDKRLGSRQPSKRFSVVIKSAVETDTFEYVSFAVRTYKHSVTQGALLWGWRWGLRKVGCQKKYRTPS